MPSTVKLVAFEFHGVSLKTRPEAMVYRYRLKGYEEDWKNTHDQRVEYPDLPIGEYTFEVKAVNRDLEYSEQPATVRLMVHPPYGTIALACGLGLALVGLVIASGYGIKRRRERDQARERLMQEMGEELQTAHDMQMGLMPKAPPRIEGFEVTGRCTPANHVGGDLFQYFHQDRKLTIGLADVTGHAMAAAVPLLVFSGILESQMELGGELGEIVRRLNHSLCRTLTRHTFVCFMMGELELASRRLRLVNAGCPYPYHFRVATGEVVELRVDAYPLGIRPDTRYPVIEVQLAPGDRVVFCSDGIIEAANAEGKLFGFERTAEVIRTGCQEGLSAEALLERLMAEVRSFRDEVPQGDDQTVVVVQVGR